MNSIKSLIILNSFLIANNLSKICQKYSSGKKTKNTNNEKNPKNVMKFFTKSKNF